MLSSTAPAPHASQAPATLLAREVELHAAELESALFSFFKCLFSHRRRRGRSSTRGFFKVQIKCWQEQKTHQQAGIHSCLFHHLLQLGLGAGQFNLKEPEQIWSRSTPLGHRVRLARLYSTRITADFPRIDPPGQTECLQDGPPGSQTWTFNTPAT